jgi:hypothetical protein
MAPTYTRTAGKSLAPRRSWRGSTEISCLALFAIHRLLSA